MTADTLDKSPVRTGLRFDSSWDSTVWMTWGTSDDGIFYLFITDYIFKIENIYLCVEQKRFGGHGVHWSSILMFPLGVGIPRFAHKPCRRQLSACGLWSLQRLHVWIPGQLPWRRRTTSTWTWSLTASYTTIRTIDFSKDILHPPAEHKCILSSSAHQRVPMEYCYERKWNV